MSEVRRGLLAQPEPCPVCDGNGCEEGCGNRGGCEYAYAGADSHRVCGDCDGTGKGLGVYADDDEHVPAVAVADVLALIDAEIDGPPTMRGRVDAMTRLRAALTKEAVDE